MIRIVFYKFSMYWRSKSDQWLKALAIGILKHSRMDGRTERHFPFSLFAFWPLVKWLFCKITRNRCVSSIKCADAISDRSVPAITMTELIFPFENIHHSQFDHSQSRAIVVFTENVTVAQIGYLLIKYVIVG